MKGFLVLLRDRKGILLDLDVMPEPVSSSLMT